MISMINFIRLSFLQLTFRWSLIFVGCRFERKFGFWPFWPKTWFDVSWWWLWRDSMREWVSGERAFVLLYIELILLCVLLVCCVRFKWTWCLLVLCWGLRACVCVVCVKNCFVFRFAFHFKKKTFMYFDFWDKSWWSYDVMLCVLLLYVRPSRSLWHLYIMTCILFLFLSFPFFFYFLLSFYL